MLEDRILSSCDRSENCPAIPVRRVERHSWFGAGLPEAEGAISADWLVIGGGFARLSAAKRLTELRGDNRIVFEAGRIGEGRRGAIAAS